MRKIRKSKPPEQAIEQYTLYHTVVYTCPYCSAQLGGSETSRRPERRLKRLKTTSPKTRRAYETIRRCYETGRQPD